LSSSRSQRTLCERDLSRWWTMMVIFALCCERGVIGDVYISRLTARDMHSGLGTGGSEVCNSPFPRNLNYPVY
jgi:hypothetical protein